MLLDSVQHQIQDVTTNVVEVLINEAICRLLEFLLEVFRLVIQALVCITLAFDFVEEHHSYQLRDSPPIDTSHQYQPCQ